MSSSCNSLLALHSAYPVLDYAASDDELEGCMAQVCDICGKGSMVGNTISHAHNVTKRRFHPNLKSVRTTVGGQSKRMRVCTRCLRSGRVTKTTR